MRKMFLALSYVFVLSILLTGISCSENNVESDNITNFVLEKNNLPDLSVIRNADIGFELDEGREAKLDRKENKLLLPVNSFDISMFNSDFSDMIDISRQTRDIGICIKIARLNPRPNKPDSCSDCVCGLGFRCGVFVCSNQQSPFIYSVNELSQDQVQPIEIIYDGDNEILEYVFLNNVDWDYFEEQDL